MADDMGTYKPDIYGPARTITTPKARGIFGRLKAAGRDFWAALFGHLPETDGKPFWRRAGIRLKVIYRRYGWKILMAVIIYYLIRDTILYIILPYLVVKQIL